MSNAIARLQDGTTKVVGREAELSRLHHHLGRALQGERQIVLISGEPGIGKTTLLEAFIADLTAAGKVARPALDCLVARGQCVDRFGTGDAYRPLLEGLAELVRGERGGEVVAVLREHAPTWLVQMAALLDPVSLAALERTTSGANSERVHRELAAALESLAAATPLILVVEDLHWSDASTLDALVVLAQRPQPARLFVLATFRPLDGVDAAHPLHGAVQKLGETGAATELPLSHLSERAVSEYLSARFSEQALVRVVARAIHRHTTGNPLFMVNVIDHLAAQGGLLASTAAAGAPLERLDDSTPHDLRQIIERHIERLPYEEQELLEAASVSGLEFTVAAIAAALGKEVAEVHAACESVLRRGHLVQARGTVDWPDGTSTARYGFAHTLYQQVLADRLDPDRRAGLHLGVGRRLEAGYGVKAREIAVELAVHFEAGGDVRRAIEYHRHAAESARRRSAYREAIDYISHALRLIEKLPDGRERLELELYFQMALGATLMVPKGYAWREVRQAYARARELCDRVGVTPQIFPVLWGLWTFHLIRGDLTASDELARQLCAIAESGADPRRRMLAHLAAGTQRYWRGELLEARARLEEGIQLYDPLRELGGLVFHRRLGEDPGVALRVYLGWALLLLGYPDQSRARLEEALGLAQEVGHAPTLGYAYCYSTVVYQYCGDRERASSLTDALLALTREHELAHWAVMGKAQLGWQLGTHGHLNEATTQIRDAIAHYWAIGGQLSQTPLLAWLADMQRMAGRTAEGLKVVAEALAAAHRTGEWFFAPELHRIEAELLAASAAREQREQAEGSFRRAIALAHEESALWLELRAVLGLARWLRDRRRRDEARPLLAAVHGRFSEGFDTDDLRAARDLIEELSA